MPDQSLRSICKRLVAEYLEKREKRQVAKLIAELPPEPALFNAYDRAFLWRLRIRP